MLILKTGYRQVTIQHKQARIVHAHRHELPVMLALVLQILAVFVLKETRAESPIYLNISTERDYDFSFLLLLNL